ncbi:MULTISPECIES: hypothetical protein [unclassified Variovorax]|jgi:hypothetical protein|uniref:hypothetical protein n=1 Tax=unclassified Variovorax TaxID=663243 RepID=UPI0019856BEB|nr:MULTISPECIES: hypothetical protein [unclassified Variovorax]MBC7392401.1 hypothetical protein [Variovorax sp.]MEB0058347.1 hypothetical protein [Variovorax sp. LG9.2]MEB0111883.1 hypothetical protein [Variovorax sp. RTB1]
MKASPGARSWIAAGVRHELLTRALPALRHDMAAPVSVIRMALLMLKRQVAAPQIDAAAVEQRVSLIDNQIGELVIGVRSLRDWELAIDDDGITRSVLVAECIGLMRAAFDLNGVRIEIDPSLEAATAPADEPRWPNGAALRYLFLGAMAHLHDSVDEVGSIAVSADGANALQLTASVRSAEIADRVADAHRAPRALAIDAIAMQSLADDLGYAVSVAPDSVRLVLAPG